MTTRTRTLTITALDEISSGISKNDQPWTLWRVTAIDAASNPINAEIKTFQTLPIGEQLTVEVERQDHEKYGTSYLLRSPTHDASSSSTLPDRLARLEERVDALEATR